MSEKWSYNVINEDVEDQDNTNIITQPSTSTNGGKTTTTTTRNPSTESNLSLPDDTTRWKNTLSNTAQSANADAEQRMAFLAEQEQDDVVNVEQQDLTLKKGISMTDSQGIDICDDTQIVINEIQSKIDSDNKDKQIQKLKQYIAKIEGEKKSLIEENARLKKRNQDLRKTLKLKTNFSFL